MWMGCDYRCTQNRRIAYENVWAAKGTLIVMELVSGEVVVVSAGLAWFSLPTVLVQHYDRSSCCSFSSSFIFVSLSFSSCTILQSFFSVSDVTVERSTPTWLMFRESWITNPEVSYPDRLVNWLCCVPAGKFRDSIAVNATAAAWLFIIP